MKYAARCEGCDASLRFNTYDERADWVGRHRVRTGHDVTMETVE